MQDTVNMMLLASVYSSILISMFHFSNVTNANYHILLVEYTRAIIKTFWIPLCFS